MLVFDLIARARERIASNEAGETQGDHRPGANPILTSTLHNARCVCRSRASCKPLTIDIAYQKVTSKVFNSPRFKRLELSGAELVLS